jgi:hypothetical protein
MEEVKMCGRLVGCERGMGKDGGGGIGVYVSMGMVVGRH